AFVEDRSEISIEAVGSAEALALSADATPEAQAAAVNPQLEDGVTAPSQSLASTPQSASAKASVAHAESASIRVPTEKVDKLINLVGELVITQSMISQTLEHFSLAKLNQLRESITELERNTRELQERVMAVRMMPIGNSFSRFPRLVRDLATQLNKKIAVQMIGEETELDKGVIERISDPLTHLVRNAADHGIESPEERRAVGKPEQGTIRLQAYHQGGNVIIEVGDDGRGLNVERIKQKALAQGLIGPEDNLSEEQLHALIFHPGFSTAAVVSDVSGRGVGMDVVKKNIEALNGSVTVVSELGKGSCLRIKLPLTLAIIDGLSVKVGDDIYILPLVSIVESIRPRPEQVKRLFGRGEVIAVRGEFLPLIRLYHLFNTPTHIIDPSKGLVVIVETEGKKSGILVDELLGQAQVVIKNLEANYQKVEGVVGATILGDGRVALILDVQGLIHLAVQGSGGMSLALFEEEPMLEEGARVSLMNAEMSEASV
ncbi:MAG: chemotaxis protein CheA, partial [Candidatus Binatia bacterium]